MKFRIHLLIQIFLFLILISFMDLHSALTITLAHFIPSLDWFMKKANFYPELHRKLFHNLFVLTLSFLIILYFTNTLIGILSAANILFHIIILDTRGKGVAIFFPISEFRLKIWK